MTSHYILLVDDDSLLCRSVAFSLERAGYRVTTAASAEDALALADRDPPRPGASRYRLARHGWPGTPCLALSAKRPHVPPIIFLTVPARESEQVLGLELGADDYLTKPFDKDVLLAHIKAVLRRVQQPAAPPLGPQPLRVGDLTIEPRTHQVTVGNRVVDLTWREFDLLYTLGLGTRAVSAPAEDLLARRAGASTGASPK